MITTTVITTTATRAITTTMAAAEAATASADFDPQHAGRPGRGRPAQQLAELFEAHAPMVLGLCRGMLRHAQDAEDAAQQTFLSAYSSLARGTTPREPAAWLATIARNECRTRVRRQMREPVFDGEPVAETSDPAAQVVRSEELESLRAALAGLPGQQRDAFVLREFSGLSYDELAGALGVTRPAVESLLFRARSQLRVSLRTALAGVASVPASLRDWFVQLFAGSPESPATIAKIGSLPIAAKIASATAGTALVAAGVVAATPPSHHHAVSKAAPAPVHAEPKRAAKPQSVRPVARVAVQPVALKVRRSATAPVASHPPRETESHHGSGEPERHDGPGPAATPEPRPSHEDGRSSREGPSTEGEHQATTSTQPQPRPAEVVTTEHSDGVGDHVESSGEGSSGSGDSGADSGQAPEEDHHSGSG